MEEAAKAVAQAVEHVNSELQLAALIAVCVLVGFGMYLAKIAGDSKKLIELKETSAKKLIEEKETAEKERTQHRKEERDREIAGITSRFDTEIKGIREDFANHLETHKTEDHRLYDRLGKIEDNMHSININLAEIKIRMAMSETEKVRHEHNQ